MNIANEQNPNVIGELLRSLFVPSKKDGGLGFYNNFDFVQGAIGRNGYVANGDMRNVVDFQDIRCEYTDDPEGELFFQLPDGRMLVTYNRHKDYRWEWIK